MERSTFKLTVADYSATSGMKQPNAHRKRPNEKRGCSSGSEESRERAKRDSEAGEVRGGEEHAVTGDSLALTNLWASLLAQTSEHSKPSRHPAGVRQTAPPADSNMIPCGYSESISQAVVPCHSEEDVVSYCDLLADNRCREGVTIGPGLAPTGYRSSIICIKDCTKRKYINRVDYQTKMKPLRYSETYYMRPREVVKSFATFLDYHADSTRKWYTSTMQLKPKSQGTELSLNMNSENNDSVSSSSSSSDVITSSVNAMNSNHHVNVREINNNISQSQQNSIRSGPFLYNVRPRNQNNIPNENENECDNGYPLMNGYADELDNESGYPQAINGYA